MRVTVIGHASILVEAGGVSVLSDPWWDSPCFGAQWWHYPKPATSVVYERPPDYVYISHGHHDHLHPGTLRTLNRDAKVLVSSQLDLADGIRQLGFDVIELDPDTPRALSGTLNAWLWPTYGGDSLLVLWDSEESCINLNDALHAAPRPVQDHHLSLLKERFPNPRYVFCGYGIASHFPNCYRIPGKDDAATAARRQEHFNAQWSYIMHQLRPEFAFPFAASVVFLENDLVGLNEVVHNAQRPTDKFRSLYGETDIRLVDAAPGFAIEGGRVVSDRLFQPLNMRDVLASDAAAVARANTYTEPSDEQIDAIVALLRENIDVCRQYLLEYRGDYRFLLSFRASEKGIAITRRGRDITVERVQGAEARDYDVCFVTRAAYLRRSLSEPYGDEILFVGSGGVFEYQDREKADANLHRELATMLRRHVEPPRSRFGDNPRWMFRLKGLAKAILGRRSDDLYDLKRWVVYKETT